MDMKDALRAKFDEELQKQMDDGNASRRSLTPTGANGSAGGAGIPHLQRRQREDGGRGPVTYDTILRPEGL